jgi:hypothetical protein
VPEIAVVVTKPVTVTELVIITEAVIVTEHVVVAKPFSIYIAVTNRFHYISTLRVMKATQ